MTRQESVPPRFELAAYNCPHCGVYAKQTWFYHVSGAFYFMGEGARSGEIDGLSISKCEYCSELVMWLRDRIIFPETSTAPKAHADMPENVEVVFEEARMVLDNSPRASAALLRLAVDLICDELGAAGTNLNQKIGSLVQLGLPKEAQKVFDSIRGFGNDALHPPGEIFKEDDRDTAILLFDLLNLAVEKTITDTQTIEGIYSRLPEGMKDSIEKRDGAQDEEQ